MRSVPDRIRLLIDEARAEPVSVALISAPRMEDAPWALTEIPPEFSGLGVSRLKPNRSGLVAVPDEIAQVENLRVPSSAPKRPCMMSRVPWGVVAES